MSILIGLAILVLATIVIAYFAARTWHWVYVLVVVGIVLSSAGFFILSAEVLRINAVLRKSYNDTQKQLDEVNARVVALQRGTEDANLVNQLRSLELKMPEDATSIRGINDLAHEIRLKTQIRGPMWSNVMPGGMDPQTGAVRIGVEAPTPSGIVANTVVYLFEAGEPALPDPRTGKQYLGEFRVVEANAQAAVLMSTLSMTEYQQQRLAASTGPWVMYEAMPPDRHETFAGLSEEQLRQKIPPTSVDEYLRHGKETKTDDEPLRKAAFNDEGKRLTADAEGNFPEGSSAVYSRRLRDYTQEFRKLAERRAVLLTNKTGLEFDNRQLREALASAQQLTAFRQDEITKLNTDLAGLAKDRQTLGQFMTLIEQQLERINLLLDQAMQQNGQLARELADRQAAAASALNEASAAEERPSPAVVGSAR